MLAAIGLQASVEYSDPEADSDDTGEVAAVGFGPPEGRALLWLVAGAGAHHRRPPGAGRHRSDGGAGRASGRRGRRRRVVQPPRDWEEAQLRYYGAQFADPAGNLIEVLCRPDGE